MFSALGVPQGSKTLVVYLEKMLKLIIHILFIRYWTEVYTFVQFECRQNDNVCHY
jgi:hypothetical protein